MNQVTVLDTTTLTNNPDGVAGLSQELFYDDVLKAIFFRIDNELIFVGDGYDYIFDIIFDQSICTQIDFSLRIGTGSSTEVFAGLIHASDFTEIDPLRKMLKTPVNDNNISSFIFKNRTIKTYVDAPFTKNAIALTVTTSVLMDFFIPSTGLYTTVTDVKCWSVDDCFRFLVGFMSDGEVSYTSPYFGTGGAGNNLFITTGNMIREKAQNAATGYPSPHISFEELFTEMDKILNLSMYIDHTTTPPQLVIDQTANLYSETDLQTFENVNDIKISLERERLYTKLKIGSQITQTEDNGTFTLSDIRFLNFKQEEYHILGQCNAGETELNLVNQYILDSNVIEDLLVNFNASYEENIVIIETDYPTTNQTKRYDNFVSGSYIYNKSLNNYQKSVNYLGAIPNDIAAYVSDDSNKFEATKSSYSLASGVIIHPTETFDPANNHSTVTGRFTCPPGGDGAYSFTVYYADLDYSGFPGIPAGTYLGDLYLRKYNSASVLQQTITIGHYEWADLDTIFDTGGTGVFSLVAGDYVVVEGAVGTGSVIYSSGTTFRGDFIDVEGGTFQTYDPKDYKIMKVEFTTPLTQTEFINIRDNIKNKVTVKSNSNVFKGWIKSISRNILTGMSKIILRTSNSSI